MTTTTEEIVSNPVYNIRAKLDNCHTDIIVVHYLPETEPLLRRCLYSLAAYTGSPYSLHVVNNGPRPLQNATLSKVSHLCHIYDTGKNLGWIGGINYVKDKVKGPFVLMLNNDTQIIDFDFGWLRRLQLPFFLYPNIGATGPVSNAAMNLQFINCAEFLPRRHNSPVLSGFCLLTKKEILDKVGWLDESLPACDDVDFCMRLHDAGYLPVICRDVTVLHSYGATGKRVYNEYWNSQDYADSGNIALIRKHGLKKYLSLQFMTTSYVEMPMDEAFEQQKNEINEIGLWVQGEKGLTLGCGDKKYPGTVGVDLVPGGEKGFAASQINTQSQADIIADIEKNLPFDNDSQDYIIAEDVLEHMVNLVGSVLEWKRILKPGGRLIVLVPDEDRCDSIVLDATHTHVFDLDSTKDLFEQCGFNILENKRITPGNGLLTVAEKL